MRVASVPDCATSRRPVPANDAVEDGLEAYEELELEDVREQEEAPVAPPPGLLRRMWNAIARRINGLIVSTYKLVGFAVLTAIVIALVAYLGTSVFFWFSRSWVAPTVISPTDERVLQLRSKLAEEATSRDRIIAEMADADRVIAMHADYLENARKALIEELADRKLELQQLLALGSDLKQTRVALKADSQAYSVISRDRLTAEYEARLINREAVVSGALQLSQLAQGNLTVAERALALDKRRAELMRETDALAAIVSKTPARRHSLSVLRILQELRRSQLELAKAGDNRQVLQNSLDRYDEIVRTINDSPYLLAAAHKTNLALAPYENLPNMKPGAPIFACDYGFVMCRRVGEVKAVLAGEVALKHPVQNTMLRGLPLQLDLTDARAAEEKSLFAGRPPLGF